MKKLLVIGIIGLFLGLIVLPNTYSIQLSYTEDNIPPITLIQITGKMRVVGWYRTPVKIRITASDDHGMGDIYYIFDGNTYTVEGYVAEFIIETCGAHNLEFWGIDAAGNEEIPHHKVPVFYSFSPHDDNRFYITEPRPGFYIFGNKIIDFDTVFIIGAFTIEAMSLDPECGIYKVSFYLDNELIGQDTSAPYSTYCNKKHTGKGTIKAIASDLSNNTAEDTLDVYYFKFR